MTAPIKLIALVGHERPRSRTRLVAEAAATALLERAPGGASAETVDLSELGPVLLDRPTADELRRQVADADLLVVASPTYKASYTGILKIFLDGYQGPALSGRVAVPLMVAGSAHHALAADVHLRPLLLELGATCPTPSLFVLDSEADERSPVVATWAERAWPMLARCVPA